MQKIYFSPEWVSELKSKADIVRILSDYLQLNKKGNIYWALCPFHHEKTPSFAINDDGQFYHCFGCGEGGDVINFIEKIESVSYIEALEIIAKKVGMELPQEGNGEKIIKEKNEKNEILKILNEALKIYKKNLYLESAKNAQEYVKSRNFKKSDLENFNIGYANGNAIVYDLLKLGFKKEYLIKSGIAGEDDQTGKLYDKLANRLIFPVLNSYGECIGFSGRILEKSSVRAKYKNTQQTLVFDKGNSVYAIDLLKESKRKGELKEIILVEGQIDVITMHSHGFNNTVASLGTSLTEKHANVLSRLCNDIIIIYDGDSAGEKATLRSIDILKKENFNIKVVKLPENCDPDEYLRKYGAESLRNLINNAVSPVEYKLNLLREKLNLNSPNGKSIYLKKSFEIIKEVETYSERDIYLNIINKESGVPIDILRKDFEKETNKKELKKEQNVLILKEDGNIKAVKFVLGAILNKEDFTKGQNYLKNYLINPIYLNLLEKFERFGDIEKLLLNSNEEEKIFIKDIIQNYSKGLGKDYYDQCVWKIKEATLKLKQQMLSEQYKNSTSNEERKIIAIKLNEIIKELSERKI